MVAGKVKAAMGFQKSPATPKQSTPSPSSGGGFSRSFGVYFPRSSAQVQPKPPEIADLLRTIERLRETESRLRTQLLEHKLLFETASIVPFLEKESAEKDIKIAHLEEKNSFLISENKRLEGEIEELKKVSASQRFQGLVEVSAKSNLLKNLRKSPNAAPKESALPKLESVEKAECAEEKPKGPRIPTPPPMPTRKSTSSSCSSSTSSSTDTAASMARPAPPPPPPPPMAKGARNAGASVRRAPEVVEFYHSLMRRDSKRETGGGAVDGSSAANTKNMIGEIENRSAHLLAIKSDVETQGDFIRSLIKEVQNAAFANIEDLVAFVKWLDDELSYLVDERAVLKHFDWPEQKSDAMREAAFGYCDLKKLESEASSFRDNRLPCSSALKKMQTLLEKLEHGVYNLSRVREGAAKRYKGFQIPWEWMMDSGFVIQIKLASVKLAMKYMRRVSKELETLAGSTEEEDLILQGVRFAFRVHQFAGGFDTETMRAFQELRDKAIFLQSQKQNSIPMSMSC